MRSGLDGVIDQLIVLGLLLGLSCVVAWSWVIQDIRAERRAKREVRNRD